MKIKDNINIEELIKEIYNRNLTEKCALFIWGLLLYAISFTVFFAQYNIVTGGSTGLSILVREFIDIENSPKNLLLRATLTNKHPNEQIKEELDKTINELGVNQTLYNLIFK